MQLAMPTVIRRTSMNLNASAETSARVTRASSSRAFGPAIWKPVRLSEIFSTRDAVLHMLLEPAADASPARHSWR